MSSGSLNSSTYYGRVNSCGSKNGGCEGYHLFLKQTRTLLHFKRGFRWQHSYIIAIINGRLKRNIKHQSREAGGQASHVSELPFPLNEFPEWSFCGG
jgi:hypothetical protein